MGQRAGQKQGPRGRKEREVGVAGRPRSHREPTEKRGKMNQVLS